MTSLRFPAAGAACAFAAISPFFAVAALAGEAQFLDIIVVIGTTPLAGSETDVSRIPAPVQRASSEDIERTHATDLTDFMKRSLGSVYVNEVQNNSLQPDVNFRGYTASPLLGTPQGMSVYLDGVRLNQPFGDVVSWDLIPKSAIASMTLMPGSNPLFGLNTLGGALSIRTKDGFNSPNTSVEVTGGSSSLRSIEAETGGHSDNGLYWFVTGNQLKSDGWRDSSPTDAKQAFGKIGWRNDATDIALSGAYANTDLTGNGLQEQRFLTRDYESVYTKPDTTQNHAALVNFTASQKLNDRWSLSGNAYYRNIRTATENGDLNDDSLGENLYQPGETQANTPFPSSSCIDNILLDGEPDEQCNGIMNRTHDSQHEHGITFQASSNTALAGHANQFTVGVAYARSEAHFTQGTQFGYLKPDRGIAPVDGPGAFAEDASVDLTGTTTVRSVYATDTFEPLRAFNVTISGRYDRTTVDNHDALTPSDEEGTLTANHRFSRFNPAIGATYSFAPEASVYAGYTEGSRAPSAIELGCADPNNPCRLPNAMAGDPPLDQVVTKTIEAGARGHVGAFIWNTGVFSATNYDDIMFVADNIAGFGYFKNFGRTRRQGVELGANVDVGSLSFGAHYTYLDATYRSSEIVSGVGNSSNDADAPGFDGNIEVHSGDRIPLTPRHIFKTMATWQALPVLRLNADMVYVGSSFARGNENNQHEPDGVFYLGRGSVGGYSVFNLGLEFEPIAHFQLFGQIDNLFNRRYATAAQLGVTAFDGTGNFVARPFAAPVIDGERPQLGATFYAPGAIRSWTVGARYTF
jgi:outer membrane receptor protein involved in Fe transport